MRGARLVWIMALGAGCGADPLPMDGAWTLDGDGARGTLVVEAGRPWSAGRASIGLWGEGFGTPGVVEARLDEESPGEIWAWFPMRTGVGEGTAALRIEGTTGRLPLGARPGEHDQHLTLASGMLPGAEQERLSERSAARLDALEAAWTEGSFRLMDGQALVGDLQLRGAGDAPLVAVYDEMWLTAGRVEAQRADEGADLLLAFDVQPNLGGERGMLRINVPTSLVVVPTGPVPDSLDRRLRLVPGTVSDAQRTERIAAAREAAAGTEQEQLVRLLPQLARAARSPDGRCLAPADVDPAWPLLLAGYSARVLPVGDRCVVEVEASPIQHGRRFRGAVDGSGLLEGGTGRGEVTAPR